MNITMFLVAVFSLMGGAGMIGCCISIVRKKTASTTGEEYFLFDLSLFYLAIALVIGRDVLGMPNFLVVVLTIVALLAAIDIIRNIWRLGQGKTH